MIVMQRTRGIVLSMLINIALFIPDCAAQDKGPLDSSRRINRAARGQCTLEAAQFPAVFKLRLGMSLGEVVARFPAFPQLSGFAKGKLEELDLKDNAGEQTLLARRDRQNGAESIEVKGSYLKRHGPAGLSTKGLGRMTLLFSDRRLVLISISDWESPKWNNTDTFVDEVSRVYGFSRRWWQQEEVKPAPPDAPLGYRDFFSPVTGFECNGFKVEANCIGPPAPTGRCSLSIRNTGQSRR